MERARAIGADYEVMRRAAESAAAKVARRGHLEWEELRQVGWTAILEAAERYDPSRGTPFGAFAHRAAIYACERACWRAIRDSVRQACLRLRIYDVESVDAEQSSNFDHAEWEREVRAEVRKILAEGEVTPDAMLLVLRERKAKDLAADLGCSVDKIYNESWELRKRLRASKELARLWRNR